MCRRGSCYRFSIIPISHRERCYQHIRFSYLIYLRKQLQSVCVSIKQWKLSLIANKIKCVSLYMKNIIDLLFCEWDWLFLILVNFCQCKAPVPSLQLGIWISTKTCSYHFSEAISTKYEIGCHVHFCCLKS